MYTLKEIYQFVSDRDEETLKSYYEKCYDTLKEINKRSSLLSVFVLILLAHEKGYSHGRSEKGDQVNTGNRLFLRRRQDDLAA